MSDHENPVADLWQTLRSCLVSFFGLFGWLPPLEELLRKVIYVDAVAPMPTASADAAAHRFAQTAHPPLHRT